MSNDEQYQPPAIQPGQSQMTEPITRSQAVDEAAPVAAAIVPANEPVVVAEQMPSRRELHQGRHPAPAYDASAYQPGAPVAYQPGATTQQPVAPATYQPGAQPVVSAQEPSYQIAAQPSYENQYAYPPGALQNPGYQQVVAQHQQPVYHVAAPTRRKSIFPAALTGGLIGALLASGLTAAVMHAQTGTMRPVTFPVATATDPGRVDDPVVTGSSVNNPVWQEVISSVADSVVAIQADVPGGGSVGSGFIIDNAGHVLSNNHVVSGARDNQVEVTLADGRLYMGEILGTDAVTDLALLQLIDFPPDLHPVALGDSDAVRVGDAVLAVGNPLGLTNTATTGIVSALDRPVTAGGSPDLATTTTNAIQIDAAVNPGNSGGPIFDATGRVIGVTSSIASLSGMPGQGSIGLGFAIPINLVKNITEQLINHGEAEHAFMGVRIEPGTATSGGVTRRGALVRSVTAGSPAAQAGLQVGDVIVAINDRPVNSHESVTAIVREHRAGDVIRVTLVRGNTMHEVAVTLDALDAEAQEVPPASPDLQVPPTEPPAETEDPADPEQQ